MKFKTVADASRANLSRLTSWSKDTATERAYLTSENARITLDPSRKTMFVKSNDRRIALYANNVAGNGDSTRGPRCNDSKSGRYKSIRHLSEVLFSKNPALTVSEFQKAVMKEYPTSSIAGITCYAHFCYYRHHIVVQKRFQYLTATGKGA